MVIDLHEWKKNKSLVDPAEIREELREIFRNPYLVLAEVKMDPTRVEIKVVDDAASSSGQTGVLHKVFDKSGVRVLVNELFEETQEAITRYKQL